MLAAQDAGTDVFSKAPPEVDAALRSQVDKFYQAHVDGKFRVAEQCVCEDSKDFFYEMEKQKYLGQELLKINYEDNFTKATVVVGIEIDWRNPRLGTMRVKPPVNSLWKVDNGQWCWYIVRENKWKTPFGTMTPGPESSQVMEIFKTNDPKKILSAVKTDRKEIELKSDEVSSAEFSVTNTMAGPISLKLQLPPVKGLTGKIDKEALKPGEKAKVLLAYAPEDQLAKKPEMVSVLVSPTNQSLGVKVNFSIPTALQKQIPEGAQLPK